MAFRILNEEELPLLTDNQKAQYEKELAIYQKRVAFVEQLEKYDNVEIEPFHPKLEMIDTVDAVGVKTYQRQDYKIQLQKMIGKPELQVNLVQIEKKAGIKLPAVLVQTTDIKFLHKIEKNKPGLPTVKKPFMVVQRFEKPEGEQLELPVVSSPETIAGGYNKINKIRPKLSDITVPDAVLISFAALEQSEVELPKVAIDAPTSQLFEKPEVLIDKLPKVKKVNADSIQMYKKPKAPTVEIPKVPKSKVTSMRTFEKRKTSVVALPEIPKPNVAGIRTFETSEVTVKNLKKTQLPEMGVVNFIKPDMAETNLPFISKPVVKANRFKNPMVYMQKLPETEVKIPVEKQGKPIQAERIELSTPQIKAVTIKPFTKAHSKKVIIPKRDTVMVPDAYAALKEFFSVLQDEKKILEG